jgi:hypothetical protein
MSLVKGPLAGWFVPAALGAGAIGVIDGSIEPVGAGQDASQPLRCEIQVQEHGNSVALEGLVFMARARGALRVPGVQAYRPQSMADMSVRLHDICSGL